jgi:hypothetical protein
MSKHDFDDHGDRDEIYGKGKESRKKRRGFREHGHNKVRDFKRDYSQAIDREDLSIGRQR